METETFHLQTATKIDDITNESSKAQKYKVLSWADWMLNLFNDDFDN